MGQLEGKVALVTGANRGIGKGIALAFVREGASVVLAARDQALLQQAAAEIGGTTLAVPTDVTEEVQVKRLFTRIQERFGRLEILVNNAGAFDGGPIEQLTLDAWEKVMAVNLRGPFLCTRGAFGMMKRQGGGRIINIASIAARRVRPHTAAYSTSKHGLWGLTQVTMLEGREHGIVCSCLYPGNTRVDRMEDRAESQYQEPMMTVQEQAEAVVFMASQPPHVNVLEAVVMPARQAFIGRG